VEEKFKRGEKDSLAKLNLIEDELVARLSSGNPESSKETSLENKCRCGRGHGRGRSGGSLMTTLGCWLLRRQRRPRQHRW
jgi:hypothetical protein